MILGLSIPAFTTLHVVISLVAIAAGVPATARMLAGRWPDHRPDHRPDGRPDGRPDRWTALFLVTTVLTSVTGFLFPVAPVTPAQAVGAVSLVALGAAIAALMVFRLAGPWRPVFVVGALAAFYLNVFVGVTQSFQKIGFLNALAPTQTEPAFAAAQIATLLAFVGIAVGALRRFRPAARPADRPAPTAPA